MLFIPFEIPLFLGLTHFKTYSLTCRTVRSRWLRLVVRCARLARRDTQPVRRAAPGALQHLSAVVVSGHGEFPVPVAAGDGPGGMDENPRPAPVFVRLGATTAGLTGFRGDFCQTGSESRPPESS